MNTTMIAVIGIAEVLLDVVWWLIIVQVVLSWLVAFNVVNTYNPFVRGLLTGLDKMTDPLYRPIRRILPDFGGIDFSPMVVLLLIGLLQRVLADAAVQIMMSSMR